MGRKKNPDPAPDIHGRVTVINLKGTIEQREHLEKVSRKTMVPASRIVRAGIDLWMRQNGHSPFPGLEDNDDRAVTNGAIGADKPVPKPAPKASSKPAPKRTGGR
jgi:Ribbon-helix-helix domain